MIIKVFQWFLLYNFFENIVNQKRARNYVSFIHSLSVIYNVYNNESIKNVSQSYFIFDLLYIILTDIHKELLYIFHHLCSLYVINDIYENNNQYLATVFNYGEISNFFTYIIYDLIQIKANENLINKLKWIQFIWFFLIRVLLFTKIIIYDYDEIINLQSRYAIFGLYIMGITWTFYMKSRLKTIYVISNR